MPEERKKLHAIERIRLNKSPEKLDVDSVTSAIAASADQVRKSAEELTEIIQRFQDWLGKLPGRTHSCCVVNHPTAHPADEVAAFGLQLHRTDKRWVISYAEFDYDNDQEARYSPLITAPLNIKLMAIRLFPDLLLSIKFSQELLIKQVDDAKAEFETFAARVGIPPEVI